MTSVREEVVRLRHEFASLWWDSDSGPPDLGEPVDRSIQRENERRLASVVDQILAEAKRVPADPGERRAAGRRLAEAGREVVKATMGLDDAHIDVLERGGFVECSRAFAKRAHRFDPAISPEDTLQASRNVWTMNGIQRMLGLPVQLTPSVFAYSLLYPYTDNALDRPDVSEAEKLCTTKRFGRRLHGEPLTAESPEEGKLFRLMAEIEGEHPRGAAAQVYESLYAIQEAQVRSIALLRSGEPPYGSDVLGIAIEKGGASVLADGYLVAGTLKLAQARLFFGLGALLQLGDDLQDVGDDQRSGLATIFSQTAGHWPLDHLANRLFGFRVRVLEHLASLDAPEAVPLADLMRKATLQLILNAAGSAPRLFSQAYVNRLQMHSPFQFRELRRQRRKLEGARVSGLSLLASAAEEGSESRLADPWGT